MIRTSAVPALTLALTLAAHSARAQAPPAGSASSDSLMARLRATAAAAAADTSAEAEADSDAVAPPGAAVDTTVRVTGTRLRFGMTQERVRGLVQAFEHSKQRGRRGEQVRDCEARWFGMDASGTLYFHEGHLVRARFVVKSPSPHDLLYAEDQLLSAGFKRTCERTDPGNRDCEWRGPTIIHAVTDAQGLAGTIEPAPRPKPVLAPPPPPRPLPEVFVLEKSGVTYDVPLPEFAFRQKPVFPKTKAAAGVMGRVWIRSQVDTTGTPLEPWIVKSIAPLDSSALTAARATRFKPYVIDGKVRRITVEFPVVFTLQ